MAAFRNRTRIVVVGKNVTDESVRVRLRRRTGRYGNRSEIAGPEVGQVSVLVSQSAESLPADSDVHRQLAADGPVILEKSGLIAERVIVDDAADAASDAEQAKYE